MRHVHRNGPPDSRGATKLTSAQQSFASDIAPTRDSAVSSFSILVGVLALLAGGQSALGQQPSTGSETPAGYVGEGQAWSTPWYDIRSGQVGPTVLVTGGVHGNEPAGSSAAEQIRFWPIKSGRLVVVPRVNKSGLKANTRWFPPSRNDRKLRDLNRTFPNGPDTAPRGPLAEALWKLVKETKPDYVIDLHEGFDFHTVNKKSVGSSVICSPGEDTNRLAALMHTRVNSTITGKDRKFDLLNRSGAVRGSLVRACAERLAVPAFILETTFKGQSLSLRTRQHRTMVSALLNEIGLLDQDCTRIVGLRNRGRLVRVGLFDGAGTSAAGRNNLTTTFNDITRFSISQIGATDIDEQSLSQFDVLIFSGGSGSKQGKALGAKRRKAVQAFVRNGGGIVGICAGAYLCSSHYSWSLDVINTAVYNKMEDIPDVGRKSMWYRGGPSDVKMELTGSGTRILGISDQTNVRYQNGPIVSPGKNTAVGEYTVLAWFRTEVAKYAVQKGTMVNTPAIISAEFGKGRVLSVSPHPEATRSLRPAVIRGVLWAAKREAPDR